MRLLAAVCLGLGSLGLLTQAAAANLPTLELSEGTLDLSDKEHGKGLEVDGTVTLSGGVLDGGNGGGKRGVLKTHGNIISSGTILVNGPTIIMEAGGGVTTTLSGTTPLNGVTDFTKEGAGTVRLEQALTAASVRIEGGTLLLGASERLNNDASVYLGGTLATGGFTETLGALTLINSSVVLDLGTSSGSVLVFQDSSGSSWKNNTLTIANYSDSSEAIYFGSTASGLRKSQLDNISWTSPFGPGSGVVYGAIIDANGRLRPRAVPEPSTVIAVSALAAIIGWRERKKLKLLSAWARLRLRGSQLSKSS